MTKKEKENRYLERSIRKVELDMWVKVSKIQGENFSHTLFTRLVASKDTKFIGVDFSYCIFDHAYLRNCSFDNCNFTGCKFINSIFKGSSFIKCKFDYSIFDKTFIDDDIIDSNLPSESNIRQKLLRTLRTNYQQLGDNQNVNRTILLELEATKDHLRKAAFSNHNYYKKKYGGFARRTIAIYKLIKFLFWNYIWGNGEKLSNLIYTYLFILICIAVYDQAHVGLPKSDSIQHFTNTLIRSPSIFFNIEVPEYFSTIAITIIMFIRLILFAFLVSILVKRLNRR